VQTDAPLLDLDGPIEPPPPAPIPQPSVDRIKPFPGSIEALRNPDYVLYFEIKKNPQNAKQMAIRVSAFNLGPTPFVNFAMRFGVPFGWKLQAQAPSATVLEPIGGRPILQQFLVIGESDVKLRMKTQISYLYGTQPITENGEINAIFD
jgi:hypothetical protein